MSTSEVKASRAVPRSIAREFCTGRSVRILSVAHAFALVMLIFSMVQTILEGNSEIGGFTSAANLIECVVLGFSIAAYSRMKQTADDKSIRRTANVTLIYGIVELLVVLALALLYISMNSVMNSEEFLSGALMAEGDVLEESTEVLQAEWNQMFPVYIMLLVPSLFKGVALIFQFRSFKTVEVLAQGRNADSRPLTTAGIVCALAAGMALCQGILNAMLTGGAVYILLALLYCAPDVLFFYVAAQLSRRTAAQLKGE